MTEFIEPSGFKWLNCHQWFVKSFTTLSSFSLFYTRHGNAFSILRCISVKCKNCLICLICCKHCRWIIFDTHPQTTHLRNLFFRDSVHFHLKTWWTWWNKRACHARQTMNVCAVHCEAWRWMQQLSRESQLSFSFNRMSFLFIYWHKIPTSIHSNW